MSQDYNATLNLTKTDFPMRANLPQREPAMLQEFERRGLYKKLMKKNAGKPNYTLHEMCIRDSYDGTRSFGRSAPSIGAS